VTCPTIRPLLELYVDGELDTARGRELESHLEGCADCSRVRQQLLSLRQALRSEVPRFPAPAGLREHIRNEVRRASRPRYVVPPQVWPWLTAASLLLAAGGVVFGVRGGRSSGDDSLAQQVVSAHIRSVQTDTKHLTDVASTDRHEVKPWFVGRIDYPAPAKDLQDEGYTLVGGRLDYVNQRPVSALVYQRRKHIINVFVWPDDGAAPAAQPRNQRGYHVVPFKHAGMTGWVVSDLEGSELEEFTRLYQEALDR
jgi:anti-sigma factor RsiW